MDVTMASAPGLTGNQDQLHSIALILGQIINKAFAFRISVFDWERLVSMVQDWLEKVPSNIKPFSKSQRVASSAVGELPQFWFLQDFHGEFRTNETRTIVNHEITDFGNVISFCEAVRPRRTHYTHRICAPEPDPTTTRSMRWL